MSPSQDIVRPQFELRVNGIANPAIRFGMSDLEPDDFEHVARRFEGSLAFPWWGSG